MAPIKIWLDDVRSPPDGYTHLCRWPSEVIQLLQWAAKENIRVEEISLDHDLGEGSRTGYDVLKWLEEVVFKDGFEPPKRIHIHSANPVAKERMKAAIESIRRYAEMTLM